MSDQGQQEQPFKPYIQADTSGIVPIGHHKKNNEIVYFSRVHNDWKTQDEIKRIRKEGRGYYERLHFDSVGEIADHSYFLNNFSQHQQDVEFRGLARTRVEFKSKPVSAEDIAHAKDVLAAQQKLAGSVVIREIMGREAFKTAYDALDRQQRLSPEFNEAALEVMPLGIFTGVSLVRFDGQRPLSGAIYSEFNARSAVPLLHRMQMMGGFDFKEEPMTMKENAFEHTDNFHKLDREAKRASTASLMEGSVLSRWPDDAPTDNLFLVYGYEHFDNQVQTNAQSFFDQVKAYAKGLRSEGAQKESRANFIVTKIPTPFI